MKRMMIVCLLVNVIGLTSCYQTPEIGTAKITIYNSSGYREPGATVHLYGPSGSYIDHSGITDMNGEFYYEHDKNLQVILNVHAENTSGTSWCDGIIRIEPDKNENESYTLYP